MKSKRSTAAHRAAELIASECVGARVRMLNRAMTRLYDEQLRPHGIKFSQMNILTVVTRRGPIQPVQVAEILALEKSTLSRNLKVMQAEGWIEIAAAESGNAQVLTTSADGERLLVRASRAWRTAQDMVVARLGKSVTAALHSAAEHF